VAEDFEFVFPQRTQDSTNGEAELRKCVNMKETEKEIKARR